MPRPRSEQPTPAELEILKILWDRGPSSGREVHEQLGAEGTERAYTSVTSLMNVMVEKRLLRRTPDGRAFRYVAVLPRRKTLAGIVQDLVGRAFEGSPSQLVAHLLDATNLTPEDNGSFRRSAGGWLKYAAERTSERRSAWAQLRRERTPRPHGDTARQFRLCPTKSRHRDPPPS